MTHINPIKALSETLPESGQLMPALFIGHGSPTNALEDNEFTRSWKKLGAEIPQPKAVLCISAHWLTRGTHVTAMEAPRTIHDFGGFGEELFQAQYPAKGDPKLAGEIKETITSTPVGLDHDWGFDHGTWSVLKQMYPDANIPVLQLSIDIRQKPQYHYELSKELHSLRKKGVLIIGSGNMVHNLRAIDMSHGFGADKNGNIKEFAFDWTTEFNEFMKTAIDGGDYKKVVNFNDMGKIAQLAHPTPDHFYPLLYTLGVVSPKEKVTYFNDKCFVGSLSMTSVMFG